MDVYELRRQRLNELLRSVMAAEIAERSGIPASLISRYRAAPEVRGSKNLGEKNARRIERAAHKPAGWLDRPGPPDTTLSALPPAWKVEEAPVVTWQSLASRSSDVRMFWVALVDDAMAPRAPRGHKVCFDRRETPQPGDGILVRDRHGDLHFRQYRAAAAGRWTAHALNDAYAPLDSERDGLEVLAVLIAESGRWS
jgi:hypothetical protein